MSLPWLWTCRVWAWRNRASPAACHRCPCRTAQPAPSGWSGAATTSPAVSQVTMNLHVCITEFLSRHIAQKKPSKRLSRHATASRSLSGLPACLPTGARERAAKGLTALVGLAVGEGYSYIPADLRALMQSGEHPASDLQPPAAIACSFGGSGTQLRGATCLPFEGPFSQLSLPLPPCQQSACPRQPSATPPPS
jgi:hypothetical protein